MPKLTAGESSGGDDYDAIPNDEVVAVRLADIEEKDQEFTNKETGEKETSTRLRWAFVVTEPGPWEGRTVSGMSSTSFVAHPNCKAYNWASALMGGYQFATGESLDTDDLVGKPARVIISQNEKNGRVYENVVNVLQARTAGTTGSVTPPSQTVATETPF